MIHQSGHFGELLQGRLGPGGPVVLVTLPCPALGVRARLRPGRGLRLHGGLPLAQGRALLTRLGLPPPGRVILHALAAPGTGTGVSTAGLVALARLSGWDGPPDILARACIAIEGASDPLMFAAPERILWASRQGQVVARMPALPRFEVLGGFFGPTQRTDAADTTFPDIADLIEDWQKTRDLAGFAGLASQSATRTQALRGPVDDPTPDLASDLGALGWCRAHTGAARGLIFAPGTVPTRGTEALRTAGLRGVMRFTGGSA
jgi:uncharacterized protein involved in propanediol utilization